MLFFLILLFLRYQGFKVSNFGKVHKNSLPNEFGKYFVSYASVRKVLWIKPVSHFEGYQFYSGSFYPTVTVFDLPIINCDKMWKNSFYVLATFFEPFLKSNFRKSWETCTMIISCGKPWEKALKHGQTLRGFNAPNLVAEKVFIPGGPIVWKLFFEQVPTIQFHHLALNSSSK